ncbi:MULTISPECIES: helix-turn-helix domain-containing protein [Hyphomonas]|uniref:helix-turn-helix domain-containing protein n=1 Tax=Hyphomonas TaxID=85 RepID=UPI00054EE89E|nr:helix-turn-helix domain-containing protein [Hyphomonas jannaschiana]
MSESKLPSGIDRVVGQRIRWRRRELKLSQEQLGELLHLTFQQVQKYEKGVNRVSAGRLFEIASVMGVNVNYFYDGAENMLDDGRLTVAEDGPGTGGPAAPVLDAETLDLIAAFRKIEDDSLRKSLLNTVRAAASAFESKQDED